MKITPSGQACAAEVTGVDLTKPLSDETVAAIRSAWLEHHVLSFPDQPMNDDDLERFTQYFGGFGHDPFFDPIEGRQYIAAIRRDADEKSPLFAENWHSDWSFQAQPPAGTCHPAGRWRHIVRQPACCARCDVARNARAI